MFRGSEFSGIWPRSSAMVPRSAGAQGGPPWTDTPTTRSSRGIGTPLMRDLARLMPGRPRHALPLAVLLLLSLLLAPAARAGAGDPTNPFVGQRQFLNCEDRSSRGQAWAPWWQADSTKGRRRARLMRTARVPVVK